MNNGNIDPSVEDVVKPIDAVKLWLVGTIFYAAREATSWDDDETTFAIGMKFPEVYIDWSIA